MLRLSVSVPTVTIGAVRVVHLTPPDRSAAPSLVQPQARLPTVERKGTLFVV